MCNKPSCRNRACTNFYRTANVHRADRRDGIDCTFEQTIGCSSIAVSYTHLDVYKRQLLKKCGYESTDADYALRHLRGRLENNEDFPHEIGLFLGYPLGDVIGFVENEGRNSLCCGCWKVYCNECEALQTFRKFKKCTEVYTHLWNQGKSVLQLTVAAQHKFKFQGGYHLSLIHI